MRPLVLDVSRLLTGLRFAGPTGVETLELGLARQLPPGPGLALTPWGARMATPGTRARIAAAAAARWREDSGAQEAELRPIAAFLRGDAVALPAPPPARSLIGAARFLPGLLRGPAALPERAVTLHMGFFRLERPEFFAFRRKRADLGMIVAFHDVLPLKHPAWFRPGEADLHARRLITALTAADALAVPARVVGDEIAAFATAHGLARPPIHVLDLPVAARFAQTPPFAGDAPYMVVCGTIEPRKNHALLLEAWRRLGPRAPRLVIAGRRGWRNDALFAALEARPDRVLEAPGLSSGAIAALVRGAAALLSPSLDEGYGLPVAEALSAGTPVIAADTPVYRELWGGAATLLPPDDADSWAHAIAAPPARRPPFRRTDWPSYVSALTALAGSI